MTQETTIVKIYNEKYNKYWTCTLKSYKTTWCNNGWVLVGLCEVEKPAYKETIRPWEQKKKKSWFKRIIDKLFFKK